VLTNIGNLQMRTRRSLCIDASVTDVKVFKDAFYNKKKLNNDDIMKDLETSENEVESIESNLKNVGKNQNNHSSITLTFRRLPGQFMYKVIEHKIGMTEKNLRSTRAKVYADKTSRRHSNINRAHLNYNIDYLWDKAEQNLNEINLKSPSIRRKSTRTSLNRKDAEETKVTTRKRSVQVFSKQDLEGSNQEFENENEVDENIMHNANSNLSPKRLKTRLISNQIPTEIASQLKTPSKCNVKSLKESMDKSSKDISELETPSKRDRKSVKKSISTSTKLLTQLRTPSKSDIQASNISMNTPTKAFEELKLNESSRRITRRKINSLENKNTPNKSIYKLSNDEIPETPKINTRSRSAKFTKSYFSDFESEDNDDSDEYKVNSDCSEDETSDESEDIEDKASTDSEDSSSEYLDSVKRKKYTKRVLATTRKSSNVVLKTPSKTLNRTLKSSLETPTKRLSRLSLKNSMTPSVHQRTANISKPSTPLQEMRLKLHVSVLPKSLPCREEQFNDIYSYLHARLSDGSGGYASCI
jgi:hypothetical protein